MYKEDGLGFSIKRGGGIGFDLRGWYCGFVVGISYSKPSHKSIHSGSDRGRFESLWILKGRDLEGRGGGKGGEG